MNRYWSLKMRGSPHVFAAFALASLTGIEGRRGVSDHLPRIASTAVFEESVGQFARDIKFAGSGQSRRPVAVTARGGTSPRRVSVWPATFPADPVPSI